MKNAYLKICSLVALMLVFAVPAMATPILDFTSVGTAITGELTPALASAMPIAGTLIAVAVGYKLFRRFVK